MDFQNELTNLQNQTQFVLLPIIPEDISEFDRDSAVSEMHDRIIVGVARRLNAACITKDENITNSGVVKIIW